MASNSGSIEENPLEYVEKRIRNPLEGRRMHRSIGLTRIVGTHGTKVQSVVDLAQKGEFSAPSGDLQKTFHLTPNMLFSGWKKTAFSEDISKILGQIGLVNPLGISRQYAESSQADPRSIEDERDVDEGNGVVIAFDGKVLPLVRTVDVDDMLQEPEVVLASAPPIESVRAIYPVDEFANVTLMKALEEIR